MYRIHYSTDKAEVGSTFPQSQASENVISVDDPRHLWKQRIGKFRDDVVIPQPVLHRSAKLTDLISSAAISLRLLVSDKLKRILESNATAGDCEFSPVKLIDKKKELEYWVINPIVFRMQLVDYPKSEPWVTSSIGSKIREINIEDYSVYQKLSQEFIAPERITLYNVSFVNQVEENLVILRYVDGGIGYYVSEKLKNEIESVGCTGILFK